MKFIPPDLPKVTGGRMPGAHCDFCPLHPSQECALQCQTEVSKLETKRKEEGVAVVGPIS